MWLLQGRWMQLCQPLPALQWRRSLRRRTARFLACRLSQARVLIAGCNGLAAEVRSLAAACTGSAAPQA